MKQAAKVGVSDQRSIKMDSALCLFLIEPRSILVLQGLMDRQPSPIIS